MFKSIASISSRIRNSISSQDLRVGTTPGAPRIYSSRWNVSKSPIKIPKRTTTYPSRNTSSSSSRKSALSKENINLRYIKRRNKIAHKNIKQKSSILSPTHSFNSPNNSHSQNNNKITNNSSSHIYPRTSHKSPTPTPLSFNSFDSNPIQPTHPTNSQTVISVIVFQIIILIYIVTFIRYIMNTGIRLIIYIGH